MCLSSLTIVIRLQTGNIRHQIMAFDKPHVAYAQAHIRLHMYRIKNPAMVKGNEKYDLVCGSCAVYFTSLI